MFPFPACLPQLASGTQPGSRREPADRHVPCCRQEEFWPPERLCVYNMFNHHMFSEHGWQVYREFVKQDGGKGEGQETVNRTEVWLCCVMCCAPPASFCFT